VICGFHAWQYNRDGKAVGIPTCTMVFGKPPHEIDARLRPIELATCGAMIFGRFPPAQPSAHAAQSLEDYLGDGFTTLEAMAEIIARPIYLERSIRASWRLDMHISMDDHHSPPFHATTLGRDGYIPSMSVRRYFRVGSGGAYLLSDDEDCFDKLVSGCRDGTYRSAHFFVLQFPPDLVVALVDTDRPHWYSYILQYAPVAHDRTAFRSWSYPAPFASDFTWLTRAARPITDLFRRPIYRHCYSRVVDEDAAVCERLQETAHQVERAPILGALEERIGWFEESLRLLTATTTDEAK